MSLSISHYTQLWFMLGFSIGKGYCRQGVDIEELQDALTNYAMNKAEKAKILKMVEFAETQNVVGESHITSELICCIKKELMQ